MTMNGLHYAPDGCRHTNALVAYMETYGQVEVVVVECPDCPERHTVPRGTRVVRMVGGKVVSDGDERRNKQ